jgi:hypothetical protein
MFGWDSLLRSLGGLVGLLCVVLLPSGCYRGQALGIEHQYVVFARASRLLLIDMRSEGVPQGEALPDPLVIGVDATAPRELWRTAVPSRFITPSSNAQFAAVLGHYAAPNRVRVGLLELGSGKFRDLGVQAPDTIGNHMYRVAAALSDDGAFFASVLDGKLRVWDTTTGRLASEQDFPDDYARLVSFIDGGHDLAVVLARNADQPLVSVVVLAHQPTGWQTERTLDGVYAFAWTKRGAMYASAPGVSRYNRHGNQLLVTGLKLTDGRFSDDGRYAAYRTAQGALNVYDFDARRVVLSAEWHPRVRFHGNFVTAMSHGKLWRGDLSKGTSKVLKDFGAPAETVKIPLFGGTSTKTHYDYELNPEGTLLYYREPQHDARVYVLDQL